MTISERDRKLQEMRTAHRAAFMRSRKSDDPDTQLLREHRSVHRNNITYEETLKKKPVPKGNLRKQQDLTTFIDGGDPDGEVRSD